MKSVVVIMKTLRCYKVVFHAAGDYLGCDGNPYIETSPGGFLYSPEFPNIYPNNLQCVYEIHSEPWEVSSIITLGNRLIVLFVCNSSL